VVPDLSPIRIAIAGAGAFGREHLDRLTVRRDVQVTGIADPSAEALASARQRYGIDHCVPDARQLLQQNGVDAIIVATPAASHVDLTLQALERNICVLLEKPVAPSAALAARLAGAARAAGAFVLPGHVLRFSRDHARLVEIVRSGRIGRVLYASSRRYRDDSHATRYRDVDPVLMTMIHDIDLALWIADSPFRSVRARRSAGDSFRSMTTANAVTASGVQCELRTAWTFKAGDLPADRVEVVGEMGSVELQVGHALRLYADGQQTRMPVAEGDDALVNEHDHFLACLRDRRRQPALTLDDAVAGLALADAIADSLRRDGDVSIGG
jgi:predicted dehydrogenase